MQPTCFHSGEFLGMLEPDIRFHFLRLEQALAASVPGFFDRSRTRLRIGLLHIFAILGVATAMAAEPTISLTEVRQIREFTAEQLTYNNRAALEGVITYHDPAHQLTFFQDETGGMQIYPSPQSTDLRAGLRVRMSGRVANLGTARVLDAQDIAPLGTGILPRAIQLDSQPLPNGPLQAQWVEVKGVVRQALIRDDQLELRIAVRSGEVYARMPSQSSRTVEDYVDAQASLPGVLYSDPTSEDKSRLVLLLVSDGSQINLWPPWEPDPFRLPIQTIAKVVQLAEESPSRPLHRARLRGTITAKFPNQSVYLRDRSGSMHVRISNSPPESINVGDEVDAVGFPQFDPQLLEIREAMIRINSHHGDLHILDILPAQVLSGSHEGDLIRVYGRIIERVIRGKDLHLWLEYQGVFFRALVQSTKNIEGLKLAKGELFQLTGICTSVQRNQARGETFQLLIREASDLQWVETEIPWSPRNMLLTLGAMILTTLGAATWVLTLRRKVQQQTEQIRHRLEREAALESRCSDLVENAPDLILTYDLGGRVLSINGAGEQLSEYTRRDVIGKRIEDLLFSGSGVTDLFATSSKSAPSQGTELYLLTRFGARIPVEARWQPLITKGQPVEMQCIARDIRERKRAQEALGKSEEHLRLAIDAAQMGTWEFYPETGEVRWNNWILDQYGVEEGAFDGTLQSVLTHIHPVDRAQLERTVEVASRTGEPFQLEYRILRPDGLSRWRMVQGHGLRDDSGKVLRVIGVSQDVTPRKQAEQALREREEIYRAMFEKNRAVKLLVDPQTGEIVDANPAAASFYEYSLEDLRTKTICDLGVIPRSQTLELLRKAQTGENDLFHVRQIMSDGSERDVEVYAGLLVVGGRSLLFCIVLDVSEQVRATESMQRLNEQLESRVQQRTEELQQRVAEVEDLNSNMILLLEDLKSAHLEVAESAQQSEVANLQLKSINQELEAFSYSVSHDLRAPLRHITGFVSILEESHGSKLDAEGLRHLKTIHKAAGRMAELIDDLLAFSRLGRAQVSLSPVDLTAVARDIARELQPESEGRDVVWRIHHLAEADADPSLVRQVLQNLLENALKYSRPRQTAVIEFGTLPDRADATERIFFVRDNGVGFDMAYSNKLFGVFQRLHSATQFEGTGIGLANVRRIIVRHGGRTWAESIPDQGATFYFTLPKRSSRREFDPAAQAMGV